MFDSHRFPILIGEYLTIKFLSRLLFWLTPLASMFPAIY